RSSPSSNALSDATPKSARIQGTDVRTGRAPLDTATCHAEEVFCLSSLKAGEGRGEEADSIECPSPPSSVAGLLRRTGRAPPQSFLAGRGRKFLVVVSRCGRAGSRP